MESIGLSGRDWLRGLCGNIDHQAMERAGKSTAKPCLHQTIKETATTAERCSHWLLDQA